jgi:hypothetical protein
MVAAKPDTAGDFPTMLRNASAAAFNTTRRPSNSQPDCKPDCKTGHSPKTKWRATYLEVIFVS